MQASHFNNRPSGRLLKRCYGVHNFVRIYLTGTKSNFGAPSAGLAGSAAFAVDLASTLAAGSAGLSIGLAKSSVGAVTAGAFAPPAPTPKSKFNEGDA